MGLLLKKYVLLRSFRGTVRPSVTGIAGPFTGALC